MNPYSVLVRPVLSEKSNKCRETDSKYTFEVELQASKADIVKAIEKQFDVKVASVKTLVTRGKLRRRGNNVAKDSNKKKAVVTLVDKAKIPLFDDL